MKNLKSILSATVLVTVIAFGSTFASADGVIVNGLQDNPTTTDLPCSESTQSATDGVIVNGITGVIVNGLLGVIVNGFTGVIVNGLSESPTTCGVIVNG